MTLTHGRFTAEISTEPECFNCGNTPSTRPARNFHSCAVCEWMICGECQTQLSAELGTCNAEDCQTEAATALHERLNNVTDAALLMTVAAAAERKAA